MVSKSAGNASSWALRSCALLVLTMALGACERTISTGEFHGLRIGDDRATVFTRLKERGVAYVRPDIEGGKVVRGSKADFEVLAQSSPICVTNNAGLAVTIEFDANAVKTLSKSAATPDSVFGLAVGQMRSDAFERLGSALAADRRLLVGECLPGARWVSVASSDRAEADYLAGFSAWWYDEPGSHSSARLIFRNGKLASIVYFWRPFEMP